MDVDVMFPLILTFERKLDKMLMILLYTRSNRSLGGCVLYDF